MNRLTIGSIVTATLLLVGCGSDGSSSKSSLTDSSTPTNSGVENPVVAQKVGKGYYVDSAVEGVTYLCGSESGTTDENGTFTFESGSDCNFTIGGVNLRDINASLLEDNITILETNTTIAQLLQTLDIDGNASNGIQISPSSDSVVKETITSVDDLNQDLLEAVHARLKAEHSSEYNGTVVDKNQTVAHLNATKADLKDRNIRTHLDVEAEHRGTTDNNGSAMGSIDSTMGNISGSVDSNSNASAHVDTNGTMSAMGNMTGSHTEEGSVDSNSNASAHVDTNNGTMSAMGNMTGSHTEEGSVDSNSNASAHVDTNATVGDMTGSHNTETNIDSSNNDSTHIDNSLTSNNSVKNDSATTQGEHSSSASAQTQTNSNSSESSSSSSTTGTMGGFGRRK